MGRSATLARILESEPFQVLMAFAAVALFIAFARFGVLGLAFRVFCGAVLAFLVLVSIQALVSGEVRRTVVQAPITTALRALGLALGGGYFGAVAYFGPQGVIDAIPSWVRAAFPFVTLGTYVLSILSRHRRHATKVT